jgi:ethanolamine transporter EutH
MQQQKKIIEIIGAAQNIDQTTKDALIASAVDLLADKGLLKSKTVRNGLIAVAAGSIAVISEILAWVVTGADLNVDVSLEIIVGGVIGIVTGINAIRGRISADVDVNPRRLL